MRKRRHKQERHGGQSEAVESEAEIADAEIIESTPNPRLAEEDKALPRVAIALALLAIVTVIAALGYGYQYWSGVQSSLVEMDRNLADTAGKTAKIQASLDEARRVIESQKAEMEKQSSLLNLQEQKLATEQQKIQQQGSEMSLTLEKVYHRIGRSNSTWMAAEAEYLIQVANHRLQLEGDVATAISALEAADQRLRETGDPSWTGTRELLAIEIAALKGVERIDVVGLSAKLGGMAGQVRSLKMVGLSPVPAPPGEAEGKAVEKDSRSFDTLLKDGWEGFKSVMVVRHHDKPVSAMLSPEQQFFVYRNLELQLESARLSLLQGSQPLYDSSLQVAERWISEFFNTESGGAESLLQQLNELKSVVLKPELPDISRSLTNLRMRLQQSSEGAAQQ